MILEILLNDTEKGVFKIITYRGCNSKMRTRSAGGAKGYIYEKRTSE